MATATVSSGGDVGISPVLLQAITHTLSSSTASKTTGPAEQHVYITSRPGAAHTIKIEPSSSSSATHHLLHGMNEPVATTTVSGEAAGGGTVLYMQQRDDPEEQVETVVETEEVWTEDSCSQDSIAPPRPAAAAAQKDINMGSVLTAIATHLKNNGHVIKQEKQEEKHIPLSALSQEQMIMTHSEEEEQEETMLPVKKQRIKFADHTNTNSTFVIHKIGDSFVNASTGEPIEVQNMEGGQITIDSNSSYVLHPEGLELNNQEEYKPCPICGDKISGYHYGTFTCESCKGFFKRTVQNKKAFICHRKGDCEVSLANRKKCPACRFKHCLMAGMKLEAIRTDRQRGGRSSYDGCSPHGRPKPTGSRHSSSSSKVIISRSSTPSFSVVKSSPPSSSASIAVAGPSLPSMSAPRTPQLLEDLMAIESLMNEEEGQQACCVGKLVPGDVHLFTSLLHFADHCLYKIVRWARNLPDFSGVSTDDQILLLQNCWGELLCMCCCWHSMHANEELKLCYNRSFTLSQAQQVDMADIVQRLVDFAGHLRRLELDSYEFVAMKVLMLLTPDVRNLREEGKIRQQQEKITDALMIYTTTHYPDKPNKLCELLSLLAQLSRTVVLGKEILRVRQEQGQIPQYSLLSELLKGDVVVQSG